MKQRNITVVLVFAVLLFCSGLSSAIDNKKTDTAVDANQKSVKSEADVKHKKTTKIKLVDINSASKSELMKLPGVNADQADKIIAGRPYGSKGALFNNIILPVVSYEALKHKIICNVSKKDFDKITAQAKNKNKKQ